MDPPRRSLEDNSPPLNRTSASLLDGLRQYKQEAWKRLVVLFGPLVLYWLRQGGLNDDEAADVLQEVFAAVSTSIGRFHHLGDGSFRAWLHGITQNKYRDYHRVRQNQPRAAGGTDGLRVIHDIADEEPDDPTHPGSQEALLKSALQLIQTDFEGRTWQAFWRLTIDGHSAADVGADLGMKPVAVYQAKARVLRRLRDELGGLLNPRLD